MKYIGVYQSIFLFVCLPNSIFHMGTPLSVYFVCFYFNLLLILLNPLICVNISNQCNQKNNKSYIKPSKVACVHANVRTHSKLDVVLINMHRT